VISCRLETAARPRKRVGRRRSRGIFRNRHRAPLLPQLGSLYPACSNPPPARLLEALNRIAYPSLPIQIKVIPFSPDTFPPRVVAKFVDGGKNL
jgi:hypothetical protein